MNPTAIERAPFGAKRWIKLSNQQPNVVVAAPVAVLLAWIKKWVHRQRNNSRQHFSSRAVSAAQAAWLIHWSSFAQGTHLLYFWLLYGMLASTKMNPTKLPWTLLHNNQCCQSQCLFSDNRSVQKHLHCEKRWSWYNHISIQQWTVAF